MPVLNFTVRQLSAGGLILLPIAIIAEPPVSPLTATNLLGLAQLGLIRAAATYRFWLSCIAYLGSGPGKVLGMLSLVTAVLFVWLWLGQVLTALQLFGALIALGAVWTGQANAFPLRPTAPLWDALG